MIIIKIKLDFYFLLIIKIKESGKINNEKIKLDFYSLIIIKIKESG